MNLRPSNADRIVGCPGSVVLEMQTPEPPPSPYAEEGSRAHMIAANYLKKILAGESVKATTDMERHAYLYGHNLYDNYRSYGIEQRLDILEISPHMSGTPDFWGYDKKLTVADYKYGFGIINPFENYQLIAYASGVASTMNGWTSDLKVDLVIFQPRPYHPAGSKRVWKTTLGELQPYFDVLKEACENALSANPRFASGSHCRYCRARHGCDTLRESSLFAVDYLEHPFLTSMSDHDMGRELSMLTEAKEVIDARIDALREVALDRIKGGARMYGWNVKHRPGKLKWTDDLTTEELIERMRRFDYHITKPAVITPTQAKKMGMNIDAYSKREPGKTELVRHDTSEAERIFGK